MDFSRIQKDKIEHDLEKSSLLILDDSKYQNSTINLIRRKVALYIILEGFTTLFIYYYYSLLLEIHPLFAPTLLGSSTAALAQTINQYAKVKFSLDKICKFLVWGGINGCFTDLWINLLLSNFDNLFYRIILDQLLGAPTFQLIFNILSTLWDHGEVVPSTRATYFKSLKYSYCFWPFFSICEFTLVPENMMFPLNCLATLLWNVILSKLN